MTRLSFLRRCVSGKSHQNACFANELKVTHNVKNRYGRRGKNNTAGQSRYLVSPTLLATTLVMQKQFPLLTGCSGFEAVGLGVAFQRFPKSPGDLGHLLGIILSSEPYNPNANPFHIEACCLPPASKNRPCTKAVPSQKHVPVPSNSALGGLRLTSGLQGLGHVGQNS